MGFSVRGTAHLRYTNSASRRKAKSELSKQGVTALEAGSVSVARCIQENKQGRAHGGVQNGTPHATFLARGDLLSPQALTV
jgi:hypothetical protein